MDDGSSRDRLSNLPLGIIHTILEKIPIRDAVKTSILSKEWRYTWVTLPHLTFESFDDESSQKLKGFITQFLLLHQGPIIKFKLDAIVEVFQNVDQWLISLSRSCVRRLILRYYGEEIFRMHSNLYSCQHSLTHLEIYHCELPPPPPTFKGFSSLRCLVLIFVSVTSNSITTLLGNQTFLEELTLDNCTLGDYDLRIHAPNLKILRLLAYGFKSICLNAPLLREMSVSLITDLAPTNCSVCTYTEFLGSLSSLEELRGSFDFFKYLSICLDSSQISLEFPHLRLIELSPKVFFDKKVQSAIARLSKAAPNLHKIKVSMELYTLPLESECVSVFKFEQLKVIEIGYLGDGSCWFKLIKWLLASSPVLETLIYESQFLPDSQSLEQESMLLAFPRASPNAKILFIKRWAT